MDTGEQSPAEVRDQVYDGFISYSHAADDLLAPRLQAGLQKFAKPWWRRRAVRIFRDESSLSANPHLWSSITEALESSGWFVLLLSEDAARSEWVGKEIAYWVENRDPSRILPVVTDGEFGWVDGDVSGSAAPGSLRGVFEAEPRWVDLRGVKGEEQLDLKNPTFSAAIADVASAIRGVPKDELESEEVRQHRRTVRTAWAAGVTVTLLAAIAVVAGVFAIGQRNDARDNAALAESNALAEAEARATAEANAAAEEEARAAAEANAAEALLEAARADRTARRLIDFVSEQDFSEVDPPPRDALLASPPPRNLMVIAVPPTNTRLDFLQDHCKGETCIRVAAFIDPQRGFRTGSDQTNRGFVSASGWLAHEPFHVRHGFPNRDGESVEARVDAGYSVRIYVKREAGPDEGAFEIGRTYLFFAESVLRESTRYCGADYREQSEPVICDRWVIDFPEGLPAGRYDLWVEWEAPCATWFETDVCGSPSRPMSFFGSGVTMSFYDESFLVRGDIGNVPWPFDPWSNAEPLPGSG